MRPIEFFMAAAVVPALVLTGVAADAPKSSERKTLVKAGEFTRIYDPSVGEKEKWYINDHCFIRGEGQWHLFGITHAEPANPMDEDHLAHATASTLLRPQWKKQPFALSVVSEKPWNEEHLWAPHLVAHDGIYHMFYCAGDKDHTRYKLHVAISKDLKSWTRHPNNPLVVDGFDARDPFVLRHEGAWLMYYTANSRPEGGNHVVACVRSSDLITWTNKRVVYTDPVSGTFGGPTESPFVVRRGGNFYLFVGPRPNYNGTDVFVSKDPFQWSIEDKVGHIGAHAAEVVRDVDGKWYVSRCGWGEGGVYLAPLIWMDDLDDAETSLAVPSSPHDNEASKHLDRLPVGNALQILQQADTHQQNRLDSHPTVVAITRGFQLAAGSRQHGINLARKETVAVGGREQLPRAARDGKEFGLASEDRQAHEAESRTINMAISRDPATGSEQRMISPAGGWA